MRTNNHHRRLDKVQESLHIPDAGDGNPRFLCQICNIPDLAVARERAKCTDAATVFFVPLDGPIQRADCGEADGLSVGIALAFEGPEPTPDQIARVEGHGELAFARPELGEASGYGYAGWPFFWVVGPSLLALAVTGPKRPRPQQTL